MSNLQTLLAEMVDMYIDRTQSNVIYCSYGKTIEDMIEDYHGLVRIKELDKIAFRIAQKLAAEKHDFYIDNEQQNEIDTIMELIRKALK
jgi:hypothetical protein